MIPDPRSRPRLGHRRPLARAQAELLAFLFRKRVITFANASLQIAAQRGRLSTVYPTLPEVVGVPYIMIILLYKLQRFAVSTKISLEFDVCHWSGGFKVERILAMRNTCYRVSRLCVGKTSLIDCALYVFSWGCLKPLSPVISIRSGQYQNQCIRASINLKCEAIVKLNIYFTRCIVIDVPTAAACQLD